MSKFNYRQMLLNALDNPWQVKYEIDSYDYYLQEELSQCPIPNFHINKKIHGVYPIFGEKYKYFKRTSEELYKILEKVVKERHKAINKGTDNFGFGPFEQRLIKVTPKSGKLIRHVRFDNIYSPSYNNLQILEANPENPGGIWDNDFAVGCMARNRTKLYADLFAPNGDYDAVNIHLQKQHLLNSIVDAHEKMFGTKPKTICIGIFPEDDAHFIAHCEALYFRAQGYNSFPVNPADLVYKNGKVYAGDTQVDVLFRGFLMEEVRKHTHELDDMAAAYENQDLCVVPPFCDALGNSKLLMSEIQDKYNGLLTEKEKALVKEILPEAEVITEKNYDRLVAEAMDWVFKAGEGYGGFGVVVGRDSYSKELPSKEEIKQRPYVAQRYFPHETIKSPYYKDGKVSIETINIVLGNLVILGDYVGTLVRGSLSNVINTHQGAEILTTIHEGYYKK